MTLSELRLRAELAQKNRENDTYHYDYADTITPELILSLLNERDMLLGALTIVRDVAHPESRASIAAKNALANSADLFPNDEIGV